MLTVLSEETNDICSAASYQRYNFFSFEGQHVNKLVLCFFFYENFPFNAKMTTVLTFTTEYFSTIDYDVN